MNDLVSICIPTYNAAEFLKPCLISAIEQTYPSIEILVCDDGSTDETISIIKQFQLQHPQIRLVQNQSNIGMVQNWNKCVEEANGKWIKYLFQDDLLEKNCVEEMIKAANHFKVQVALCRRNFILHEGILPHLKRDFSEGGIPKAEIVFGDKPFISSFELATAVSRHLNQNFLGEPTCFLFQKKMFQEAGGFNLHLKQVVDYEFFVRIGLRNGFAFVPEALAHFRVHASSQSNMNNQLSRSVRKRQFRAESGDYMLLFWLYLNDESFELVRKAAGTELIETYMKHLYYSGCKHQGESLVNEAISDIRNLYPDLTKLNYNFFKYVYYRKKMKKWFRLMDSWKKASKTHSQAGSI